MRENRTYGSEGGETGLTGLPYPYQISRVSPFMRMVYLSLSECLVMDNPPKLSVVVLSAA